MRILITQTDVEKLFKSNTKFNRICIRCGKRLNGYPALSRFANVDICSSCGTAEAFENLAIREKFDFSDWALGRKVKS